MKARHSLMIVAIIAFALGFNACNGTQSPPAPAQTTTGTQKVEYTCEMHPEVLSDKPGNCPKCGMELIKKEPAKGEATAKDTAKSTNTK